MSTAAVNHRRYRASDPKRRLTGWSLVLIVHLVVGWALVSGTARRGLDFIKKPLEAAVIQEVIIPPPPPPPPKPIKQPEQQLPTPQAPPPPFVPPPDIQPPVSSSAVAVQSVPTPPVAPAVIAPPPPPVPAPRPPAPVAAPRPPEIGLVCPTQVPPEMPRRAVQEGAQGVVKAQALIRGGAVQDVTILSGPRVFHAAVRSAMLQYKCVSQAAEVLATQEFVFKLD